MVASDRVNLFWAWQYVITMRYLKMEANVSWKRAKEKGLDTLKMTKTNRPYVFYKRRLEIKVL